MFLKKTGSNRINIRLKILDPSFCHRRLLPFVLWGRARHFRHVNSCLLTRASGKVTFSTSRLKGLIDGPIKVPPLVTSRKRCPTSAERGPSPQKRAQASSATMATRTAAESEISSQIRCPQWTWGKGHRAPRVASPQERPATKQNFPHKFGFLFTFQPFSAKLIHVVQLWMTSSLSLSSHQL